MDNNNIHNNVVNERGRLMNNSNVGNNRDELMNDLNKIVQENIQAFTKQQQEEKSSEDEDLTHQSKGKYPQILTWRP